MRNKLYFSKNYFPLLLKNAGGESSLSLAAFFVFGWPVAMFRSLIFISHFYSPFAGNQVGKRKKVISRIAFLEGGAGESVLSHKPLVGL